MSEEERKFRQDFHQTITKINDSGLLPEPIIEYRIFSSGTSSVVALINPQSSPSIIKTAIDDNTINNEAIVLQHWSQSIRTPKVFFHHLSDGNIPSFINMEYISSQRLSDLMHQNKCDSQIAGKMGSSLAKLHLLPPPVLSNPDIVTFERATKSVTDKTHELINQGILKPGFLRKIEEDIEYLSTMPWNSTVCHMDFLPYNLFTENGEIIVFDPNIAIAPNLRDLANTTFVLRASNSDEPELVEVVLNGYQTLINVDQRSFQAFEHFVGVKKIINWLNKDSHRKLATAIKLLNQE